MFEEHNIIKRFKADVDVHIKIIQGEIGKGDYGEAMLWYNELLRMRESWKEELNKPGSLIIANPWVGPKVAVNTKSTVHLSQRRVEILDDAIKRVEQIFKSIKL